MTEDPRLLGSKRELAAKIAAYCARGRLLDKQTIFECENIYRDHRAAARLDGVDFPELVSLVMDRLCTITFVRRDLERDGVDNLILELVAAQKRLGYYDPNEIARAVRRTFSHHRQQS